MVCRSCNDKGIVPRPATDQFGHRLEIDPCPVCVVVDGPSKGEVVFLVAAFIVMLAAVATVFP